MHYPTDGIPHTTAFVITVVEHWLEREDFGEVQYLFAEKKERYIWWERCGGII